MQRLLKSFVSLAVAAPLVMGAHAMPVEPGNTNLCLAVNVNLGPLQQVGDPTWDATRGTWVFQYTVPTSFDCSNAPPKQTACQICVRTDVYGIDPATGKWSAAPVSSSCGQSGVPDCQTIANQNTWTFGFPAVGGGNLPAGSEWKIVFSVVSRGPFACEVLCSQTGIPYDLSTTIYTDIIPPPP